jgi:hypothetical protein
MFNENDLAAMLYLQQARAGKRLFTGRLYDPAEMAEICASRGHPLQPGWYVSGEMHAEMFALAWAREAMLHSARVYQSSNGLLYAVFGQQFGPWQHRFVLPLLGEEVKRFVRETQGKPLRFSLANCDGPQATVFAGPDDMNLLLPQGVEIGPDPVSLADVVAMSADCMRVATLMLGAEELLSAGAGTPEVKNVCVSLVQSQSFLAMIEAHVEKAGGRSLQ